MSQHDARHDSHAPHRKEARFQALPDRIAVLGEQRRRRSAAAHEGAWLDGVQTIAEFNEASRARGHRLRLSRIEGGGYGIAREGDREVLAIIPECAERVAVWCAHFYAKGLLDR